MDSHTRDDPQRDWALRVKWLDLKETEKGQEMGLLEQGKEMDHCLACTASSNRCQRHKSSLLRSKKAQRNFVLHTEHTLCHKVLKRMS